MALRNNTWKSGERYDQIVAGNDNYKGTPSERTKLYIWGNNGNGVLGQNNANPTGQQSSPIQIPGDWSKFSTSSNFSSAVNDDNELFIWGDNTGGLGGGQLGLNDIISRSSPTQVPGTNWNVTFGSYRSSFGTKTDGTLWAWGNNTFGQLGLNQVYDPGNYSNTANVSSPTQIPGTNWSNNVKQLRSTNYAHLSMKTDGTLWTWGNNNYGQMGQNNLIYRSSPVQIPGTNWNSCTVLQYNGLATKTDGTLWAWGNNSDGALGQNQAYAQLAAVSSPTQIPGTTWSSVTSSYRALFAFKTDGTLWVWGRNYRGVLGISQPENFRLSSPVQLPGTWSNVKGHGDSVLATKTDGTLWAWGQNQVGELAQNDKDVHRSSPAQIPGFWNIDGFLAAGGPGNRVMMALKA